MNLPSRQRTTLTLSMVLKLRSSIAKRVGFLGENTDVGVEKVTKGGGGEGGGGGGGEGTRSAQLRGVTLVSLRMQQIQVCVI